GLRPGRKTSHNRYIRSFVSHPPQIRACTSRAPGSSSHEFATRAIRRRYVDMVQVTMYLPGFSSTVHETAPPSLVLKLRFFATCVGGGVPSFLRNWAKWW